MYVRPHDVQLAAPSAQTLSLQVRGVQRLGGRITADFEVNGQAFELETLDTGNVALVPGGQVTVRLARYRVFPQAD